jgi:hypothetical protein
VPIAMIDRGRREWHPRTAPVHRRRAVSWARRLLGGLVTGAAAVSALVACAGTGSSEGTVVAKTDQGVYDIGCQAGGTMTGPVALPVWGRARCRRAGGWSFGTATATRPSPA